MAQSKIEWTDKVWNPILGCRHVSEGCRNCYAERMTIRLNAMAQASGNEELWAACSDVLKFDYSEVETGKAKGFNGKVSLMTNRLHQPLHWKKPSKIFVNSMSDLFHEDVPFEFIIKVISVIQICEEHTFQILTKRSERALSFFEYINGMIKSCGKACNMDDLIISNLWMGVSAENQHTFDQRRFYLSQIPTAVRFISIEPLLGNINFDFSEVGKRDWIIVGGESGPNARPMHPDWVRSIRDQCKEYKIPFMFKQWGEWIPSYNAGERSSEPGYYNKSIGDNWVKHYHQFPDGQGMVKVGKKKAGRLLDGKIYDEYPEVKNP